MVSGVTLCGAGEGHGNWKWPPCEELIGDLGDSLLMMVWECPVNVSGPLHKSSFFTVHNRSCVYVYLIANDWYHLFSPSLK